MKISVHTSHFPYGSNREGYVSGGGEQVAHRVSKGLAGRGHEVTVFTASDDERSVSTEDGMKIVRYRSFGSIGNTSVAPEQFVPNSTETDLIHIHNTTPPGVISGLLHSMGSEAPVVLTHHGNDRFVADGTVIKMAIDYAYAEVILDHILDWVDQITIPSKSYVQGSDRLSRYKSKMIEIPNGIDMDDIHSPESATYAEETFDIASDRPMVFFIGDMIEKKGPDILVEAANRLDNSIQFVIAGDGPLLSDLRESGNPQIKFTGYISEKQKVALFNRADIFCLPSRTHTEVFPLVVLEAYASGTPVIASDLSTFDRFVTDQVTGLRFKTDDAQDLSENIEKIVSDCSKLSALSDNAYQAAKEYQWNSIIDQYEEAFREVNRI
ncbi:hypothetical protein BVU17_08075 [Haloarcula taiwanensis]|uniref:Glycosyl transferase family 1 n=1 Tax=Haloarcula taiwanensis TaxID=1932004 RepID=A0A2H4ZYB4_9EURY|nr:glycosyltransferase family 4 protein [Haloarcula taiwanensis]AUG47474.1 hypothetical protein BVU17_08075 [Haloarcula taiwanensis]